MLKDTPKSLPAPSRSFFSIPGVVPAARQAGLAGRLRAMKRSREGPLDGVLVPEVELVALEERSLAGLCQVERGTHVVRLQGMAIGPEERGQGGGDGIGFPRGPHADAVEGGDAVEELRVGSCSKKCGLLVRDSPVHIHYWM